VKSPEPAEGQHRNRKERTPRRAPRGRRIVLAVCLLSLVIVAVGAWVGVRGYLAKGELEAALPLAGQLKNQVVSGDAEGAVASAVSLEKHSTEAAELTSDPVWRAAEVLPWVGSNLTVMRELASSVDDVSRSGIGPLASLTGSIGLSDFKPVAGQINLQPLLESRPVLAEASASVDDAIARVSAIDTSGTLQPLVDARQKLLGSLVEASSGLTVLNKAAQLMPAMLGSEGPRNYLVLFQNNAELRATGGIPGAMALVHTDGGSITLVQQASATDFPKFSAPVIDLPFETAALFGSNTAEYMQDVNFTPQFALSGQIAKAMWAQQFGLEVDGVISLDPVALSYLLRATGPIQLPTGDELTSENAVKLLLQDVYVRYSQPGDQDTFFAAAAASIFARVSSGDLDPSKLVMP
jgi:hypothetical protein